MKASLQQQQVFCLENNYTTIRLIQQNEKSTQVQKKKTIFHSMLTTCMHIIYILHSH